jgi:hypothetical protein
MLIMTAQNAGRSVPLVTLLFTWVFLLCGCGPPPPVPVPETLPVRLSNQEFWNMVVDFSEDGGSFPSENFLSNESGYQRVIPALLKTVTPGGVYIGVGPEQNFTYIAALRPKIAFIVDIRRQNMLEHLFYKALMETSAGRAEFLSRLFGRPALTTLPTDATSEELFRACDTSSPNRGFFEANVAHILEYLKNEKELKLSREDEAGIRHVAQAFFRSGSRLTYAFIGGNGDSRKMPSYADLMTERDGVGRNWNFLAGEDQFRAIQAMEKNNLIVPLVGDFAGDKAIRSVARYVQEHGSRVRAFYTSNVEQYLFQDNKNWKRFYDNVLVLPTDSTSSFIQYVLESRAYDRQETSLISRMDRTKNAYRGGSLQNYYDLVKLSQ